MFLWLSLYIIKEWEECFSAKRTSQIFPWEAKAGGRAEWPCGKCSALRGSSHCVAMADAACCDGRCSVLRWPMHRSASSAPGCRHVARSVAGMSLQSCSKPLLTICKQNRDAPPGASLFILYSRPVPWRLASGRLAWLLCVSASLAGAGCGRFTSSIRSSR